MSMKGVGGQQRGGAGRGGGGERTSEGGRDSIKRHGGAANISDENQKGKKDLQH